MELGTLQPHFFFALFFSAIFQFNLAEAKPVSQRFYEEIQGRQCEGVNFAEIERLKCVHSLPATNIHSLDSLAEYLVFKPIADREQATVDCLLTQTRRLRDNTEAQSIAVNATCDNLPVLKDVLSKIESLESWITTYTRVNNRSMRNVPEAEFQTNSQVLEELKKRLHIYQELEKTIRSSDPLLSSNSFYDAIKKRFQSGIVFSADTPDEACKFLRTDAKKLLDRDVSSLKKTSAAIQSKMNEGGQWIEDETFLRSLWASGSREVVWQGLKDDTKLTDSTFCRMEGRYGSGAKIRDGIYNLLLLAGGGGATALGRLTVIAATAKRSEVAVAAARSALAVDISATFFLSARETFNACKSQISNLSEKTSCQLNETSDLEFKNLLVKQISENSCFLTAGISLASGALAGISAKTALKGLNNKLDKEVLANATISKGNPVGLNRAQDINNRSSTDTEAAPAVTEVALLEKAKISPSLNSHSGKRLQSDFIMSERGIGVSVLEFKTAKDSLREIDRNLLAGHLRPPSTVELSIKVDNPQGRYEHTNQKIYVQPPSQIKKNAADRGITVDGTEVIDHEYGHAIFHENMKDYSSVWEGVTQSQHSGSRLAWNNIQALDRKAQEISDRISQLRRKIGGGYQRNQSVNRAAEESELNSLKERRTELEKKIGELLPSTSSPLSPSDLKMYRIQNKISGPYEEVFSDLILVAKRNDPAAMSRSLLNENVAGRAFQKRFERARGNNANDMHHTLDAVRNFLWNKYFVNPANKHRYPELLQSIHRTMAEEIVARSKSADLQDLELHEVEKRIINLLSSDLKKFEK